MGAFSLVGLKLKHSRWILSSHGLQPHVLELHHGCKIHCWAPSSSSISSATTTTTTSRSSSVASSAPSKPALLFLHGFGGDGTLGWERQVAEFSKHFSLYLPDLLFFGDSIVGGPDDADDGNPLLPYAANEESLASKDHQKDKVRYSEIFQAECMYEAMRKMGVQEAVVVGHSYGGFVAYRMAHLYPSFVQRLVVVSSGIMMEPNTNDALLLEFGATHIHDMLVPSTLAHFKKSLHFTFNGYLPSWLPSFFYKDMYESLSGDKQGRLKLVKDIVLGKEDAPPLPTIEQKTFIIWGEKDQIFNITLAHQLKEFLGAKAELRTIEGASHVPQVLNPKEFNKLLLLFLQIPH